MAHAVPSLQHIDTLPRELEPGERALLDALLEVLDDDWTIYIQPYLNGPTPQLFLFSEESGLAVIAVRDWNLDYYRMQPDCSWEELSSCDGVDRWHPLTSECPFREVHYLRRRILQDILPGLQAEIVLDPSLNSFFVEIVYFHEATAAQAIGVTAPAAQSEQYQYIQVLSGRDLNKDRLRHLLKRQNHQRAQLYARMMHRNQMHNALRRTLAYSNIPRTDLFDIQHSLSPKQQELLPNTPGRKRVAGCAGSGKSHLLARKAVEAAIAGQKVLVTCYNITMTNYLNELIRAHVHFDPRADEKANRRILVSHFHRLFDSQLKLKDKEALRFGEFDVILIDEAQDFDRAWLLALYALAPGPDAHLMIVEDTRQNIYGVEPKAREQLPGIIGRPHNLNASFRTNRQVAALANYLISLSHRQFDSVDIESELPVQGQLDMGQLPVWFESSPEKLLAALVHKVARLARADDKPGLAETAILVCTVAQGWDICDALDELAIPGLEYDCNFESREDNRRASAKYSQKGSEELGWRLEQLRRSRKLAFHPRTPHLKICTIHSFKGWEVPRVIVYFEPQPGSQFENRVPLLYTAMTRAKEELTVFNAEPTLSVLGRRAWANGLITLRRPLPLGA